MDLGTRVRRGVATVAATVPGLLASLARSARARSRAGSATPAQSVPPDLDGAATGTVPFPEGTYAGGESTATTHVPRPE